jgi:pimeloyl-ACP methyl ester carboxylesterase
MNRKSLMAQIRIAPVLFMTFFLSTLAVTSGICAEAHADALYKRSFVAIPGTGPAVLYQPTDPNPKKTHIGILVMHPNGNFLEHITILGNKGGPGLASLGYTVLAQNSTMSSNDILDTDKLLVEVSKGVKYLKSVEGVTKVVLLGHSGGGPTMAAYQFIAENGVAACQGPEKIVPCPNSLAGMPPADGLILLDSSLGFGAITLTSLDPAVTDENKPAQPDPKLDLYNPANGFHPPTGGTYSSTFVKEYAAGQAKRMDKLIHTALDRLAKLNAGQGTYANDAPFDIPGSELGNGQIYSYDLKWEARTHDPHWLVKPDGTRVNEVVHSLREPYKTTSSPTPKITAGYVTTVRRFLNTWACRPLPDFGYGEDYVRGIDYQSTYNSPVAAVEKIKAPLLILSMSAGQLLVTAETIYNHATSADRSLIFIEGATHGTTPINWDKYGNTTTTTVNTLDSWLSAKF